MCTLSSHCWKTVPVLILVAFVTELVLYGFGCREGRFAELWKVLEKVGAMGLVGSSLSSRSLGWLESSGV